MHSSRQLQRFSVVRTWLLAGALLQACAGTSSIPEPPATPEEPVTDANASEAAQRPGQAETASDASTPTKEEVERKLDALRQLGALLNISGQCSLLALHYSKIKGPRDMLYMLPRLYLNDKTGTKPMCEVDVFAAVPEPTLQAHVILAPEKPGGDLKSKRVRPKEYRSMTAEEQKRLDVLLRAEAAVKPKAFSVPVTIRSDDGWVVYFIGYTLEKNKLSLGPHYRVIAPDDGELTVSLLSEAGTADLVSASGEKLDSIEVTHKGELPNESHIFMSSLASVALVVKTRHGNWLVEGGKFKAID